MLDEALSLYLKYPMEMEYWYQQDEGTLDEELVAQIVGNEEIGSEIFHQAVITVYERASTSLQRMIIDPLQARLGALAEANNQLLSKPRRDGRIETYWQWGLRSREKGATWKSALGITLRSTKSKGEVSELRIYPWVWLPNKAEAEKFLKRIADEFEQSDSDKSVVLAKRSIGVAADRDPNTIVGEIYKCHERAFTHLVSFAKKI